MTKESAGIVAELIDVATETNFRSIVQEMESRGFKGHEVEKAVKQLTDKAGKSQLFGKGEFSQ